MLSAVMFFEYLPAFLNIHSLSLHNAFLSLCSWTTQDVFNVVIVALLVLQLWRSRLTSRFAVEVQQILPFLPALRSLNTKPSQRLEDELAKIRSNTNDPQFLSLQQELAALKIELEQVHKSHQIANDAFQQLLRVLLAEEGEPLKPLYFKSSPKSCPVFDMAQDDGDSDLEPSESSESSLFINEVPTITAELAGPAKPAEPMESSQPTGAAEPPPQAPGDGAKEDVSTECTASRRTSADPPAPPAEVLDPEAPAEAPAQLPPDVEEADPEALKLTPDPPLAPKPDLNLPPLSEFLNARPSSVQKPLRGPPPPNFSSFRSVPVGIKPASAPVAAATPAANPASTTSFMSRPRPTPKPIVTNVVNDPFAFAKK